jgi:hypothetical protein
VREALILRSVLAAGEHFRGRFTVLPCQPFWLLTTCLATPELSVRDRGTLIAFLFFTEYSQNRPSSQKHCKQRLYDAYASAKKKPSSPLSKDYVLRQQGTERKTIGSIKKSA